MALQLLPAVDVADGQAVRLVQGAAGSETTYGDPLEAALEPAGLEGVIVGKALYAGAFNVADALKVLDEAL